jgi:hypothetical protein
MPARLTAAWLVVLITAPFTAPFSTCDFASMLHGTAVLALQHAGVAAPRAQATNVARVGSIVALRLSRRQEGGEHGDRGTEAVASGDTAIPPAARLRTGSRSRLSLLAPAFAPSGSALFARPSCRWRPLEQHIVQDDPHSIPGVLRL